MSDPVWASLRDGPGGSVTPAELDPSRRDFRVVRFHLEQSIKGMKEVWEAHMWSTR